LNKLKLEGTDIISAVFSDLTEHTRRQIIIDKAKEVEAVIKKAAEPIVICNSEGYIIQASEPAERLAGQKLPGLHCDEFLGNFTTDHKHATLADVYGGRLHQNSEIGYDGPRGLRGDFLISFGNFAGEKDNPGLIINLADITLRKRAEVELSRLNRELRAIVESNKAMVRATVESGLLKDICQIMVEVAGYRMAWIGMAANDGDKSVLPVAWAGAETGYLKTASITWADTDRGRGPTGTAIRSGQTKFFQDFLTDPAAAPWREGALARGYKSSIALPLFDPGKKVIGALTLYSEQTNGFIPSEVTLLESLASDLSFGIRVLRERAKIAEAQERLKENEEKLRLHADNSPLAIIDIDSNFTVTRWAGAAEEIFGYKSSEMVGKSALDLKIIYEPDREIIEHTIAELANGKNRTSSAVNRNITKDGRILWCTWYNSVLFDEKGKMSSIMSEVQDITEIREMDRAKDEFISLVSHELKNPLTVILGSAQTALSPGLSESDIKFLLQNTLEGAHSMDQIINNLLELSRYQANRLKLATEEMDLVTLARKTISQVKRGYPHHVYTLQAGNIGLAVGDPIRIERIFFNLIENAAKYSPENSEIKIDIVSDKANFIVSVTDKGIGMTPENIAGLFEPFKRLVDPKEHTKGLGLGLVVCKRLVEAHEGNISVTSVLGKGSTFTFTIPMPKQAPAKKKR
jgi:PAS domain S-box-containing protein